MASPRPPIVLRDMGSFHIGGRLVELSGRPARDIALSPGGPPMRLDPNGAYQIGQMYVQYFLPRDERGTVPLLLWHGGGLTGVTYETTPDGREGWLTWFLRRGWSVYNADAVERGRAGWAPYPDFTDGPPVFLPIANPFERFRIGRGPGSWHSDPERRQVLPGNQFPVEAGYMAFVKQVVPRWTTSDAATLDAYLALVDRLGPCVVLCHSQGGQFGFKAAQARPDKVKALVAVEPAALGDPERIAALAPVPVLMLFGDYIETDARWPAMRRSALDFAAAIRAEGGRVDVVDLPAIGIAGNSHMMMMDRNNLEVADVIQRWLAQAGLHDDGRASPDQN